MRTVTLSSLPLTGTLRAAVVGSLLLVTACGGGRQSGICGEIPPPPTAQGDAAALVAAGEEAWQSRHDEASLRTAIDSWKQALAIDPSRAALRVRLARAHYFLADGHLRFDDARSAEQLDNLREATNQSELALGQQYPAFRSKYCSRQPYSVALQQLDRGAIPAMYWYGVALGKYALSTSIVEVLNNVPRIKAMMSLVRQLDPDFYYTAADRYFGAFYTKIPFPGGDLPRSKAHFEASVAASPNYLATKVLYAELYALKSGDRALFETQLKAVMDFDLDTEPDIKAENAAEKRKAEELLDEIDVYFPED